MQVKIPSLFIVGAQKAGTTTLYKILSKHPEVFMPVKKETRFFSWHYDKGFEWYCDEYFSNTKLYKITGEASPDYLIHNKVPERIRNNCGADCKIIILMRQPAKRAYSQYIMNHKLESESFAEWIQHPFKKQLKEEFKGNINSSYITQGLYYEHYRRFEQYFGEDNIRLIVFEELIGSNGLNILKELSKFLEIEDIYESFPETHANKANLPRYNFFNFIYSQSWPINAIREFISNSHIIQKQVKRVFTVKPKGVDDEVLKKVTESYFAEDINKLRELGLDLTAWEI